MVKIPTIMRRVFIYPAGTKGRSFNTSSTCRRRNRAAYFYRPLGDFITRQVSWSFLVSVTYLYSEVMIYLKKHYRFRPHYFIPIYQFCWKQCITVVLKWTGLISDCWVTIWKNQVRVAQQFMVLHIKPNFPIFILKMEAHTYPMFNKSKH